MNQENVKALLSGKRYAVLGLGISNRPLCDFLLDHGATVTVCDRKPPEELTRAEELIARGVSFSSGDHYLSPLRTEQFDFVFRSPGIRPDVPQIAAAVARGAILTSEMELFMRRSPAPIFAITGSDGKTTTTNLAYQLLKTQF